jgi:hypothetical protein
MTSLLCTFYVMFLCGLWAIAMGSVGYGPCVV